MPVLKICVRGSVQGVYFRQSTKRKAEELGIRGWVRNEPNGEVSILACGHYEALMELLNWSHHGSPAAIVTEVSYEFSSEDLKIYGFEIIGSSH